MNADETVKPAAGHETAETTPKLARQLGLFDATMIVMGGIIGSGIFINTAVVAQEVHTPFLILGAWLLGGLIALAGAFIYAELAGRYPDVGGQYAYLREAYHPSVAFIYGWALLLVTQTGGMAAVAITFSKYFLEFTHAQLPEWTVAVAALALLTFINCLGVRAGSGVQNLLMVLKIVALAALVVCGLFFIKAPHGMAGPVLDRPPSFGLLAAMGAAMTPVMFAYGGWQTASFVSGEMREPRRHLARGLLIGVVGVIVLYTIVNFVYVYVLGPDGLAAAKATASNTKPALDATPASDVMRFAFGGRGAMLIAIGISISTLGFLSQGMLTAPRVYFAMAEDGLFFKSVAWLNPRTRVPVVAIALQGVFAILIALSGKYEQILNYVISVDFIWFGLTAASLFVFRRRAVNEKESRQERIGGRRQEQEAGITKSVFPASCRLPSASSQLPTAPADCFRVPGHPVTTALFVIACALVVASTIYAHPQDSWIGLTILVAGVPVYFFWRWWRSE